MQHAIYFFVLIVGLGLTGCLYQPELTQGNVIEAEKVASLKPGMSRNEVRYIMGDPVLQNPFNADRWDYVYQVRKGEKTLQQQRVSIYFHNDNVVAIQSTE